jgi:hypothetical protein
LLKHRPTVGFLCQPGSKTRRAADDLARLYR